jgi:hypothetical protein
VFDKNTNPHQKENKMHSIKSAVFNGSTVEEIADDMLEKSKVLKKEEMDSSVLAVVATIGFFPADIATFGVIAKYHGKPPPTKPELVNELNGWMHRIQSMSQERVQHVLNAMAAGVKSAAIMVAARRKP